MTITKTLLKSMVKSKTEMIESYKKEIKDSPLTTNYNSRQIEKTKIEINLLNQLIKT